MNPQPFDMASPALAAKTGRDRVLEGAVPVLSRGGRDNLAVIPARGGTDKTGLSADGSRRINDSKMAPVNHDSGCRS